MARITVEDCLDTIGENKRFDLVHLTVERIKQHRHGEPFLVEAKNQEVVMTLREIAAGKVNFENISTLPDGGDVEGEDQAEDNSDKEEKAAA